MKNSEQTFKNAVLPGIGDINSTAKGSGARANSGKPPLHLIPLWIIAKADKLKAQQTVATSFEDWQANARHALEELGRFQCRDEEAPALFRLLGLMWNDWDACAAVFNYGRRKYAEWNWAKGMPWSAVISSCARHLTTMMHDGDTLDEESLLPHRGHVMCNVVMLLSYLTCYPDGDDRPNYLAVGPKIITDHASDSSWGALGEDKVTTAPADIELPDLHRRVECSGGMQLPDAAIPYPKGFPKIKFKESK